MLKSTFLRVNTRYQHVPPHSNYPIQNIPYIISIYAIIHIYIYTLYTYINIQSPDIPRIWTQPVGPWILPSICYDPLLWRLRVFPSAPQPWMLLLAARSLWHPVGAPVPKWPGSKEMRRSGKTMVISWLFHGFLRKKIYKLIKLAVLCVYLMSMLIQRF